MTLKLDHIVILVPELEATIASYSALGFNVQRGGTHTDGATHNALVGFQDGSYLELIAFLREAPAHRWWHYQARGWQGLVDFALLPHDTGAVIAEARARGVAYEGPFDGGRLRPDGVRLDWQTGIAPSVEMPFLCGDVTPRALRVREGDVRVHPNGVTGVAELNVVVDDLAAARARYEALLGLRAEALPAVPGLERVGLALGGTTLVLARPTGAAGAPAWAGALAARGAQAAQFVLRSPTATARTVLPLAGTQGAPIEIVPG